MMTFEKVADILAKQLSTDKTKITMETNILTDLGADSLDLVEVLMSLEDEFGISIPDEAVEEIKTVGDIVNYIEKNADAEDAED